MEELENLRPMSLAQIQLLYNSCAASGWVIPNDDLEILYIDYLQRHGYFLDYLMKLNPANRQLDEFFIEGENNVINIIDNTNTDHNVELPNRINVQNNDQILNYTCFLAESPNGDNLGTYIYNPIEMASQYLRYPVRVVRRDLVLPPRPTKQQLLQTFSEGKGLLIDFFPFPLRRDTEMRRGITQNGYTFRCHLVNYFTPFFNGILTFLGIKNITTYMICPPYITAHAYLEITENIPNLCDRLILQGDSNYTFNLDVGLTDFIENFNGINIPIAPKILEIKRHIYLNNGNNPGQRPRQI